MVLLSQVDFKAELSWNLLSMPVVLGPLHMVYLRGYIQELSQKPAVLLNARHRLAKQHFSHVPLIKAVTGQPLFKRRKQTPHFKGGSVTKSTAIFSHLQSTSYHIAPAYYLCSLHQKIFTPIQLYFCLVMKFIWDSIFKIVEGTLTQQRESMRNPRGSRQIFQFS